MPAGDGENRRLQTGKPAEIAGERTSRKAAAGETGRKLRTERREGEGTAMKTHAIIPVFIPHEGCPHDCVFCDQRSITARESAPDEEETRRLIESHLATIAENPKITAREIGPFAGVQGFTGISRAVKARNDMTGDRSGSTGSAGRDPIVSGCQRGLIISMRQF